MTSPETAPAGRAAVVLLHGLAARAWLMRHIENGLQRDGFRVLNVSYASRSSTLEELADHWLPEILDHAGIGTEDRLDFVTHSMGGILLRLHLLRHPRTHSGRTVMLAPPNAGTPIVERAGGLRLFHWYGRVNGPRLGTSPESLPRQLGPWPASRGPLGIIAGNFSVNPLFSAWLPGRDDGIVSVSSTRLEGMNDFIVLRHTHLSMLWRNDTLRQIRSFLHKGSFIHEGETEARAG